MRVVLVAVMACSSPPAPTTPKVVTDARVDADRTACEDRCESVVYSRHDACGPGAGPPWPDWCGDDNERMRENCLSTCR